MNIIYNILLILSFPFILLRLLWRSKKAPAYRKRWNERFGCFPAPKAQGGIWIHAVSLGEAIAATPLIKALQKNYSSLPITVTTMTPTGSAQITKTFGDSVFHVYVPYDFPGSVARFLKRVQPKKAIIMETELWPNLFAACHKQNIPILIANARLSERSFQGYQRIQKFMTRLLSNVTLLAAQAEADAKRFIALGLDAKKVQIAGNIKFDITPPSDLQEKALDLQTRWGKERPVVIAASTHEGEDEEILQAFAKVKQTFPDVLLVLVPRHPERFNNVHQLCLNHGFRTALRSQPNSITNDCEIFIGDTMGELLVFYATADVAFIGGSLIPHGGQNPLEPAALKLPIIMGPHIFNFKQICALLTEAKAIVFISDAQQLAQQVVDLLQDKEKRLTMGQNAFDVVENNRGAILKHLQFLEDLQ